MEILDWIQFIVGTLVLIAGLFTFGIELFGSFRFNFVINRMHAAAIGDTLGIGISLIGLMIFSGWNFTTLKIFLVIVFLWLASPVSSHLIGRFEVMTNDKIEEYCEVDKEYIENEKK